MLSVRFPAESSQTLESSQDSRYAESTSNLFQGSSPLDHSLSALLTSPTQGMLDLNSKIKASQLDIAVQHTPENKRSFYTYPPKPTDSELARHPDAIGYVTEIYDQMAEKKWLQKQPGGITVIKNCSLFPVSSLQIPSMFLLFCCLAAYLAIALARSLCSFPALFVFL